MPTIHRPFENLDVQAGKVVSLVPEEIVEKFSTEIELVTVTVNGLFAMALPRRSISISVRCC
jgi:N-hydroxyarylamine O-acetyltransferase